MERVTVGIDTEHASTRALDWAIERGRSRTIELRIVSSFDMLLVDVLAEQRRLEELKADVEARLPGTVVTTALVDGSIVETLVEASRYSDLLVLGYHRTRAVRSFLSGAVSVRVAARSHCPTVIVPDDAAGLQTGEIVAGVGDDDSAAAAVEWAAREAAASGSRLTVIHAWQIPVPSMNEVPMLLVSAEELREVHRRLLSEAVEPVLHGFPNVSVEQQLAEGRAPAVLAAAGAQASLVVIGTHRLSPVAGAVLGSTAIALLPHSAVPVCIVPLVAPLPAVAEQVRDVLGPR